MTCDSGTPGGNGCVRRKLALTYFLIKTKRKEYVKYMRLLSEGKWVWPRKQSDNASMTLRNA